MPPTTTEYDSPLLDAVETSHADTSQSPKERRPALRRTIVLTATVVLLCTVVVGLRNCGNYLIVDNAVPSDVILVPARGFRPRYVKAFELLRAGYADRIVADVPAITYIGTPAPELAAKYFGEQHGLAGKIELCVVSVDAPETTQAAKCLEKFHPRRVLIVAGPLQTRRIVKAFSRDLPQYEWSITTSQSDQPYPVKWWRDRDLAKIVYMEWNQLLWWEVFHR